HRQVQQDLAAALARAGELLAVVVHLADVLGAHEALRDHRRRADDLAVVEAHRDVAVVGGREAAVVHAPADLANLLFDLELCHGRLTLTRSRMRAQYASTGFSAGWNGAAASPPSLKPMRLPLPAPRSS